MRRVLTDGSLRVKEGVNLVAAFCWCRRHSVIRSVKERSVNPPFAPVTYDSTVVKIVAS